MSDVNTALNALQNPVAAFVQLSDLLCDAITAIRLGLQTQEKIIHEWNEAQPTTKANPTE